MAREMDGCMTLTSTAPKPREQELTPVIDRLSDRNGARRIAAVKKLMGSFSR